MPRFTEVVEKLINIPVSPDCSGIATVIFIHIKHHKELNVAVIYIRKCFSLSSKWLTSNKIITHLHLSRIKILQYYPTLGIRIRTSLNFLNSGFPNVNLWKQGNWLPWKFTSLIWNVFKCLLAVHRLNSGCLLFDLEGGIGAFDLNHDS